MLLDRPDHAGRWLRTRNPAVHARAPGPGGDRRSSAIFPSSIQLPFLSSSHTPFLCASFTTMSGVDDTFPRMAQASQTMATALVGEPLRHTFSVSQELRRPL